MRIHGICIVKDEVDIISQTLTEASSWCDFIYVLDNGSSDGTWETVKALSKTNPRIVPYRQNACMFSDALRGEIFNYFRENFSAGDWCYRLDADEFCIDNPKLFLQKVSTEYDVVCAANLIYYFTEKDLAVYEQNPNAYADDVPVEKKVRHYLNSESEIRFFRYYDHLKWLAKKDCLVKSDYRDWPMNIRGQAFPIRIWIKNYRYRSPQQIQKRLNVRRPLCDAQMFPQELRYRWEKLLAPVAKSQDFWSWRGRVVDSSKLDCDNQDDCFVIREDEMMSIRRIVESYDMQITYRNAFRHYVGRPIKRALVEKGILQKPFCSESN